ncbi:MAG: hypothetical protein K2P58_01645 [Hyphomonadaceae bacterium]|nr:hypothetical protein [Hyphomonadaceae bacterium]
MLTLNPGFALILAAFLVLTAPRQTRTWIFVAAAFAAFVLLLGREFGAAEAVAQMGLPVVFLNLDALNRMFGIAVLFALIGVGITTGARRNVVEDAAILLLAGGTLSALFVGDLISLVAAAALAGLATAWLVLTSPLPGANRAGARLLIWHGLEGLLFLVGVALHLTEGAASAVLGRMDAASVSGACIFAAIMIRVGAPLAHVWLKDAVSHASPAGGAALCAFTTLLGVYMLARLYPAEPVLTPIGMAMIALGAVYAVADYDLRRASAYALMAQTGVAVALIGIGSPIALAAAEGHAFAVIVGFTALQLALGAILHRVGSARLTALEGASGIAPIATALGIAASLAAVSTPGFAAYATHSVALDAVARWETRVLWTMIAALPGVLFVGLTLRLALAAYAPTKVQPVRNEAPFAMVLGTSLAVFFCTSVGLAPQWLYGLMPAELTFDPFAVARLAPQLQLMGVAGVVYLLLRTRRPLPAPESEIPDVDGFYRGPLAQAGQMAGVLALGLYDASKRAADASGRWLSQRFAALVALCDDPFSRRSFALTGLLALSGFLGVLLLSTSQW